MVGPSGLSSVNRGSSEAERLPSDGFGFCELRDDAELLEQA